MRRRVKTIVLAAAVTGGLGLASLPALAMPVGDLASAGVLAHGVERGQIQQTHWHWHRPHWRWHRRWGWHPHRGWHHPRWGWRHRW